MLFTDETTEGFTDTELAVLNRIAERVFAKGDDNLEVYSVSDAIMSAYYPDASETEIETAVCKRLGL
jgi:hypothetical protein